MSLLSRDYAWYIPFSFAARRPEYPGPCAVSSQKPLAFLKRRWPNSNGHASESQCDMKCNQPSLIFRVYVTPALAARKSPPALCLPGKRPPGARAFGANVALRAAGPRLRPRANDIVLAVRFGAFRTRRVEEINITRFCFPITRNLSHFLMPLRCLAIRAFERYHGSH